MGNQASQSVDIDKDRIPPNEADLEPPPRQPEDLTLHNDIDSSKGTHLAGDYLDELRIRRGAGGCIGVIGIAVVAYVVVSAIGHVNDAISRAPEGKEYLAIVAVAAHTVISLGAVWFGYQMLRAAERMFVPRRFLSDAKDVEVLRALIGINAPTTAAADQLKVLLGDTPIKSLVELIKAARSDKT
jgi:hypothetical protein